MKALFISPEHRRRILYRTHPAYRKASYVLVGCVLLQAAFVVVYGREKAGAMSAASKMRAAEAEAKSIAAMEEEAMPLVRRIQEAQEWSASLSERTWLSDVLSRVERSIPAEICLTEVTLRNRFANLKAPDRIELEMNGVSKGQGLAAWQNALQSTFEGWRLSAVRSGTPADAKSGSERQAEKLVPFSVVLIQPAPSQRTQEK